MSLTCPDCGHDGTFDGQGPEVRTFERRRPDQPAEKVTERRFRHRCTECSTEFLIVEDETVEQPQDARSEA